MISDKFEGAEEVRRAWLSGLEPDPNLTVSQWADRFRILSTRVASEPGPYRTNRAPFLREIMDTLSPQNPALEVVFMKSAQVGASELGNNWIGYSVDHSPCPMMCVQPTVDLAKRYSQQRLDPLFEDSPVLRDKVRAARSRDSGNTTMVKRYKGGVLILTGANSAVGLRSMPARNLFLDEIDAYKGDVDKEGDPIDLAVARTISFGRRAKRFLASTPTLKGASRIEARYEASDMRRYHVPCPFCGALQWLRFERLRWPKGIPEKAVYVCEHCEAEIEERHKTQMMAEESGACWIATAPAEQVNVAQRERLVGFHISGLYSPLGWLSWEAIARGWEAARGNDAKLKTFKNTILGETWQEKGEAPEWELIYNRREPWRMGHVPSWGLVLTAGADVQRDRVEIDVYAWGRGLRSALVDHIVVEGDISAQETKDGVTAILEQTWPHASGTRMSLARLAIDSGDGTNTNEVYRFARLAGRQKVMAIKGREGFDRATPVDGPTYVDVNEAGKKMRRGCQLWNVATATFKSETYRFLRLKRPTDEQMKEAAANGEEAWPEGYIHLPGSTSAEWIKQLTAEQLVTIKQKSGYPKLQWQQMRDRNEALDNRVYARAAGWLLGMDRWDDLKWASLEQQFDHGKKAEKPSGVLNRPASDKQQPKRPAGLLGKRRKGWL